MGFGNKQCDKYTDLDEAVAAIARSRYELILVDHDSISRAGLKITKAIRANEEGPNFTAPIVLLSVSTSELSIVEARDNGANFMVAKPLSPSVLLERIVWLARNPRMFVNTPAYRGPDRRFHIAPLPQGVEERRAENLRMMQTPERDLGQTEIDSLFT